MEIKAGEIVELLKKSTMDNVEEQIFFEEYATIDSNDATIFNAVEIFLRNLNFDLDVQEPRYEEMADFLYDMSKQIRKYLDELDIADYGHVTKDRWMFD